MSDPTDLWNALQTGDPACVQRALDRAVPPDLRRAYAEGEQAALAGWGDGICPYDSGEERTMWLTGWQAMQPLIGAPTLPYQPEERHNPGPGWDDNGVLHDPTQGGRAKL